MKDKQKQLITEIMDDDAKDGLYKQQTAVQWLAEQMLHPESFNPYIEQAKAMEKEQIVKAYHRGAFGNMNLEKSNLFGDAYYNETYNK